MLPRARPSSTAFITLLFVGILELHLQRPPLMDVLTSLSSVLQSNQWRKSRVVHSLEYRRLVHVPFVSGVGSSAPSRSQYILLNFTSVLLMV